MSRTLLVFVAVFLLSASLATAQRVHRHGKVRAGWVRTERVSADDSVHVVIGLRNNHQVIDDLFWKVSTPGSPFYGQYLTFEQLQALVRDDSAIQLVTEWLQSHGIPADHIEVLPSGDFIRVRTLAHRLERALETEFHNFVHSDTGVSVARVHSYSLPPHIHQVVEVISYTTHFPAPHSLRRRMRLPLSRPLRSNRLLGAEDDPPTPPPTVTPQLLFSFYGIDNPVASNPQATQSLFESLNQSFSPDDLHTFLKQFNIPTADITTIIGPNNGSDCAVNPNNCGEANLDVECIMAVAQQAPTTYWSVPTDLQQEPFLEWILAVAGTQTPPLVHSVSYGDVEADGDPDEMRRFCDEIQKMGLRGLSVLVSSGDDGVANAPARGNASACGFFPAYPATCPFVTAVGATQGPEENKTEIACASNTGGLITTGGGFSGVWSRPPYQENAVTKYLAQGTMPPLNLFNSTGRGYPDISTMGHNYEVALGGSWAIESGTSASAPVFAGIVTLVNSARLDAGKPPLGFLNTALYAFYDQGLPVYNDITSGENNCAAAETDPTCCQYGFFATAGWNAVTGLGTPKFQALKKYLANL